MEFSKKKKERKEYRFWAVPSCKYEDIFNALIIGVHRHRRIAKAYWSPASFYTQ